MLMDRPVRGNEVYIDVFKEEILERGRKKGERYFFFLRGPNPHTNNRERGYRNFYRMVLELRESVRISGKGGWPAELLHLHGRPGCSSILPLDYIKKRHPRALPLGIEEFQFVHDDIYEMKYHPHSVLIYQHNNPDVLDD